tara:strand:+ start:230 stop:415 length:186 start_codon:yes stop_codon:yes gene_type:complete
MSEILKVPTYRIQYIIATRGIKERFRASRTRVFNPEDMELIKKEIEEQDREAAEKPQEDAQ